ncbi:hypothetical protein CNR22_11825 [Sphingobacteriaceae bacterium]|nr:hypothetical protein CNR22_11825 [Sphingobacteriaceae bacterium]
MTEIQELENYIQKAQEPEERLLTEARLLLNSDLCTNLQWQKTTYILIQEFGRKKLKAEIELVHQKLFSEKKYTSFKHKILSIFKFNL